MSLLRSLLLAGFAATAGMAEAQTPSAVLGKLAPQFGKMQRSVLGNRTGCVSFLSNPNVPERAYVHISDLNGNGQADEGEPVAEIALYKTQNAGDISLHIVPDETGGYIVIKKFRANEPHRLNPRSETTDMEGPDWSTALNKALPAFSGMAAF